MKAVFAIKTGSGYDDDAADRYNFPKTYLNQVRRSVGDFILYYEPRRTLDLNAGGRQAYIAVARLIDVYPDQKRADHFYAKVDNYLDFDQPVPFKHDHEYFESALQRDDGNTNRGAFGRSVRNLSDEEFQAILRNGFDQSWIRAAPQDGASAGFEEGLVEFERPVVEVIETRWFRDRAFSRHVQEAYDHTCAITGLKIVNGGGRPEAQAAHIRPVAEFGSDSVRNGIALSSTIHWMFDRGLMSVDDDYRILMGPNVPEQIRSLTSPDRRLRLPAERGLWPHPRYLQYHRETVFKG